MEPLVLAPDEDPVAHDCASTAFYQSDLALLNYLLQDLRALVRTAASGRLTLQPHQKLTWEVHGLRRRTVVCDPVRLCDASDVNVVGFFGDRRRESLGGEIDSIEVELLGEFRNYPGILSYSSIELVDDYWANLVVHSLPGDREQWRASQIHVKAAEEIAPRSYHSVRIHNGRLLGGVIGSSTIVVDKTKYWDYDTDPVWQAVRALPGGATETVDGPVAGVG